MFLSTTMVNHLMCPHDLGLMSAENCKLGLMSVEDCKKDSNKCVECWNQIAEEG